MTTSHTIWIVDDEKSIRWVLEKALRQDNWQVSSFESGDRMLEQLQHTRPDLLITDIRMPGIDGIELLKEVQAKYPDLPVIVMTAHSDLDSAVASIQSGAFEYLPKPFEVDEVVSIVTRALAHQGKHQVSPASPVTRNGTAIIGQAPAMQEIFRAIGRLGKANVTVLISGQSGTGKEGIAQALHKHSTRAAKAFVPLNMAAIPRELIESELFGHEKGAFTGASQVYRGRFEQARGGTLFLDEIGDMLQETQTRLLRVLSDSTFYRVGGHQALQADVRVIAATNKDLEKLVAEDRFREDLFHRLNVIRLHLPTLAERREDIPDLAAHFLRRATDETGEKPKRLKPETLDYLCALPWPGNVRQLQNVCRWLAVMTTSQEVMIEDLPPGLMATGVMQTQHGQPPQQNSAQEEEVWEESLRTWAAQKMSQIKPGDPGIIKDATGRFERIMIQSALRQTRGRKRDAALLLGWGRNTLTRKILELGLADDDLSE